MSSKSRRGRKRPLAKMQQRPTLIPITCQCCGAPIAKPVVPPSSHMSLRQLFVRMHRFRLRWRWCFMLTLILAILLLIFEVEFLKHVAWGIVIEHVVQRFGANVVEVETAV